MTNNNENNCTNNAGNNAGNNQNKKGGGQAQQVSDMNAANNKSGQGKSGKKGK